MYDLADASQFNIYDSFHRYYKGPDFFVASGKNIPDGLAPITSINQSDNGHGAIFAMRNSNNIDNYPLALWNDNSYDSGGNTVYNMIYFGSTTLGGSTEYGNLIWDDTNQKFVLSQSLKVVGDLEANFLSTDSNEFLAHDIIRHTVTSGEASGGTFNESWSKATQAKIADLHAITLALTPNPDLVSADDWNTNTDCATSYDGSTITATNNGMTAWAENDVVTIYVVYEK